MTSQPMAYTNQSFYKQVIELVKKQQENDRLLEDFLACFWMQARAFMGHDNIPISEFIAWIEGSFDMPVPALSDAFLSAQLDDETTTSDAARWEKLIFCQIADLRQMQADGIFENELAFFGVTANRASTAGFREECLPIWFNLDPCSFVECGLQGAFDGWTPEAESGRKLVPGNVAVWDASSDKIVVAPADEIESNPVPMDGLTWQDMIGFQESGQYYE